jgi:hypothetical protein
MDTSGIKNCASLPSLKNLPQDTAPTAMKQSSVTKVPALHQLSATFRKAFSKTKDPSMPHFFSWIIDNKLAGMALPVEKEQVIIFL